MVGLLEKSPDHDEYLYAMLKVQLLSESLSKPLKRFKQETDPIRLCFRKKLNALENFLQRDVGMETTRPVSRSRVAYKS